MKQTDRIITAANSKTMNAVEKTALFAEAEIRETTPGFTGEEELPKTSQATRPTKPGSTGKTRKKNQ